MLSATTGERRERVDWFCFFCREETRKRGCTLAGREGRQHRSDSKIKKLKEKGKVGGFRF